MRRRDCRAALRERRRVGVPMRTRATYVYFHHFNSSILEEDSILYFEMDKSANFLILFPLWLVVSFAVHER